ncbi:MAG: EAL domain-containing protein [Steroidobacteraceae bacterium]
MKSFKNRLLILIVALMAFAEGVTIVLALAYLRSGVEEQSAHQLATSRTVLDRTLADRAVQLRAAADVLVGDFAFREAATSGDSETVLSALRNHARRIDAGVAMLYSQNGRIVASTSPIPAGFDPHLDTGDSGLLGEPAYVVLDRRPYQMVFVPLRAPEVVGYVALGFAVDEKLAEQLKAIAGSEVSFVSRDVGHGVAMVSTLAPDAASDLRSRFVDGGFAGAPRHFEVAGESYLWQIGSLPAREGSIDVVMQRSLDDALATFRQMRIALLLIGAASLFAAIVVAWRAGSSAVKPLAALVSAADRMRQGRYDQAIGATGEGEFRQLAESFNSMQSAIREREVRIVEQATRDGLTGLLNRFAFQQWLSELRPSREPLTVVLFDVHRFRDINASVGQADADRMLCALAQRFVQLGSAPDRCARVGVDQFALALSDNDTGAQRLARLLADDLRHGLPVAGFHIVIELRAGIAEWRSTQGAADLLRQADVALANAKEANETCKVYLASHDEEQRRRVLLVSELRKAIATNALHLNFQPLVLMTTREAHSFEALVRWTHPQLGVISPSEFVPLAERASAVADLSRWVLANAIQQLGRWRREGVTVELAINLSASDMGDPELPARVLGLLQQHEVDARQLMLEVTESAIMHEPQRAALIMQQLRTAGVKFAIDDFGTGHSSLAQLTSLPVDELKIDRSFVINLERSSSNQAIVRSTTELGHILGLRVVAEGVETPEAWSSLLRLGCDFAQGYFVSRPMAGDDVPAWLETQRTRLSRVLAEAKQEGTVAALKLRPPQITS